MERRARGGFDLGEENAIEGVGLTISEMQGVARRQLAGSLVVGLLILAVAAGLALRSNRVAEPRYSVAHGAAQQPVFVTPSRHVIAATKHEIETP